MFNTTDLNQQKEKFFQNMDGVEFERLYRSYWKNIFGIIYHYTKDKEISSEIAQDLFTSIWERRQTLIIKSNIEHYLFKAAKLAAFDYLKTTVRQNELRECALRDYCGTLNCTEESIAYNELNGKVNLLIDQLPCRCREVYRLSQQLGQSNKNIASALLISEKTVEYHLYKATSFIRTNLQELQLHKLK